MLGWLLHAPRGPFYSPKAARTVGDQQGRLRLPSVGPVRHRTATVACPVLISFLFWRRQPLHLGVGWRTGHCPVHTRQFGAPFRPLVRATRRPRIARPTIAQSTVGSPDSPVHHQTVRWILAVRHWTFPESDDFAADDSLDSSVHHRIVRWIIAIRHHRVPSVAFSPRLVWRTGHCPVHHGTVRYTQTEQQLAVQSQLFSNFFFPVSST
jgi:hypothetical protein